MKVALLSCGRSDYSVYFPLITALKKKPSIDLNIIAFGTHLSQAHGHTVDFFHQDGFDVAHEVESLPIGDSSEAIAVAMGLTTMKFSSLWAREKFDLIFAMGDRYEMFSAVVAAVPFVIPVAHIHGGETTLGAIDNVLRHSLTSISKYHFVSTENHARRVAEIRGSSENVFNVGALALDNLVDIKLLSIREINDQFSVDLSRPTIITTFHPETVSFQRNIEYVDVLTKVLKSIEDYQIVVTMPNADTMGSKVREKLQSYCAGASNAIAIENFGRVAYYSCLENCAFLLGNTSSGIIEAASFGKYVINIGDRQSGREAGKSVIHCPIEYDALMRQIRSIKNLPALSRNNIYGDGNASRKIIEVLETLN